MHRSRTMAVEATFLLLLQELSPGAQKRCTSGRLSCYYTQHYIQLSYLNVATLKNCGH